MFSNVGGVIKGIACVLLVVGVILCIAGTFQPGPGHRLPETGWLTLLVRLAGIGAAATLLYGFGELVASSRESARNSAQVLALLQEHLQEHHAAQMRSAERANNAAGAQLVGTARVNGGQWRCSKCGAYNPETTTSCQECGAFQ